jgi:hypothetical protein
MGTVLRYVVRFVDSGNPIPDFSGPDFIVQTVASKEFKSEEGMNTGNYYQAITYSRLLNFKLPGAISCSLRLEEEKDPTCGIWYSLGGYTRGASQRALKMLIVGRGAMRSTIIFTNKCRYKHFIHLLVVNIPRIEFVFCKKNRPSLVGILATGRES